MAELKWRQNVFSHFVQTSGIRCVHTLTNLRKVHICSLQLAYSFPNTSFSNIYSAATACRVSAAEGASVTSFTGFSQCQTTEDSSIFSRLHSQAQKVKPEAIINRMSSHMCVHLQNVPRCGRVWGRCVRSCWRGRSMLARVCVCVKKMQKN